MEGCTRLWNAAQDELCEASRRRWAAMDCGGAQGEKVREARKRSQERFKCCHLDRVLGVERELMEGEGSCDCI